MRKFLYFISADSRHLQTRLDRLGEKGLELMTADGLFTATFQKTNRRDLRYFVVPYGNQKNYPSHLDASLYGWELIGGFNGMAIFKSLPCEETDEDGLLTKLRQDDAVHVDHHSIPLMLALLFLFGVGAAVLFQMLPELSSRWYLSYAGLCLPFVATVCFLLFAANLLSLRSYLSAWIHGLTIPVFVGCVFFSLIIWQLDNSGQIWFFAGFLLLFALACVLTFWRLNRIVACSLAGFSLMILCVGLAFPHVDQTEFGTLSLRRYTEDLQVVTLEDVGVEEELAVSGYRTQGTALVDKTTYWELSDGGTSCTCEVYDCINVVLADIVFEQLRSTGQWIQSEEGFLRDDGKTILFRRRNTIAVVQFSNGFDSACSETVYRTLFE